MSNKFLVFILSLALLGLIVAVVKESYRKLELDREIASLNTEIKTLKSENELLTNLLDYFSSDKSLEKEARLKLNLLKPGESLVIVDDKNAPDNQSLEGTKEKQLSNFKKWLIYLFD